MTQQDAPIDWQGILKITNNKPELAKEMVIMLGEELPDMQKSINQALSDKNYALLLDKVHKLHGSCCYCGVPQLKKIAATLEVQLKENQHGQLNELVTQLNQEIKRILHYINEQALVL